VFLQHLVSKKRNINAFALWTIRLSLENLFVGRA